MKFFELMRLESSAYNGYSDVPKTFFNKIMLRGIMGEFLEVLWNIFEF